MNYLKTSILLSALTAIIIFAGFLLGGEVGMIISIIIALSTNLFAYWNSDKILLKMYGAYEINMHTEPTYYNTVRNLAKKSGLPMPRVYILENDQPNAFATGRNPENGAVAATTGLLNTLNKNEVAGVMAHELAHIKNRDTLIMTITATLAGALTMLAAFAMFFGGRSRNGVLGSLGSIVIMIIAPIAASLVQMAISRTREYEADKIGAEICGNPEWLASALEKLDSTSKYIENKHAENNPASAHLFIVNPIYKKSIDSLFSTHPKVANRVNILRGMINTSHKLKTGPWG